MKKILLYAFVLVITLSNFFYSLRLYDQASEIEWGIEVSPHGALFATFFVGVAFLFAAAGAYILKKDKVFALIGMLSLVYSIKDCLELGGNPRILTAMVVAMGIVAWQLLKKEKPKLKFLYVTNFTKR